MSCTWCRPCERSLCYCGPCPDLTCPTCWEDTVDNTHRVVYPADWVDSDSEGSGGDTDLT